MSWATYLRSHPRALSLLCALAATSAGIAYLAAAGAPFLYIAVNAGALAIGLAAARVLVLAMRVGDPRFAGATMLAVGFALLATALLGVSVEGASRWVRGGGMFVQPSLLLMPAMVVAYAHRNGAPGTVGMILVAAALALQPDRAMAGALVVGLGAVALVRPGRSVAVALAAALAGFAATLWRADALPAVPYVDGILRTSFDVHPLAGLAVVGGAGALIVPAIIGLARDPASRSTHAAFGGVWLAVVIAAALGNYPTPLVGYGASAIIGYLLCVAILPGQIGGAATAAREHRHHANRTRDEGLRRAIA